uniref:B-block binding subunit of TFIIIC domain-containing protein n=1 Tax=Pygocentrus nattereri TaxID=42514 RepID=A0AAR2L3A0_PYGNA
MDPLAALLDEVSLEGLDGVTLETLWLRLSARRPAFPLRLEPRVQQYLWNVLACSPDVTFHLLPRARAPLHLYDRFSDIDPETGIQDVRPLDFEAQPEDPYPVSVLVDDPQGIQGSCLYYRERKDITHLIRTSQHTPVLTLEEAQKQYGEKLVLVASQELRYRALIGDEGNPELKLSDYSYCILERLGRARWQGEIQRDLHISSFKLDAGKVHYLRKSLDRNGLITLQSHVVRLPTGVRQHSILLLLKRFHVDRRSKYDILMESTSNLLSELPNNIGIMLRLREQLVGEHTFKRVYQYMQAAKMVSVLTIPLQELNPEAGPCKTKRGTDIRVRCLKLLRPYTRKETYDDDDDENNDEDADGLVKRNIQAQARDIERDLLTQAYEIVVANGPKGISQSVLRGQLNIGRLESRMVCKVLERNNMIKGFMEDEGRQRTTKYISKLFVEKSNLNLRFAKELERSEKLRVPKNDSTDPGNGPCPDPEDQEDALRNDPETEQDPQEEEEEEAHKGQRSKGKAGKKSKSAKKGSQRAVPSTPRHSTPSDFKSSDFFSFYSEKPPPRIKDTDQSIQEVEPSKIVKQDDTLLVPQDHTLSIPHSQSETADDTVTVVEEVVDELEMSARKRGHEQHETYRMLKRKNLIIEAVRNLKVIEGLYTLQKKLMDEEKQDGVSTKVCKKSIVRLTRSLSRDGYLKLFRTTVIQDGVSRKVEFVVHPSVTPDDPLVKSAIEQVRFKISSSYTVHRPVPQPAVGQSVLYRNQSVLMLLFVYIPVPGLSRSLGFQPKMPRFRMVHSFLFYLMYDHPFRQTTFNDPSLTADPTVGITADHEGNLATSSSGTERDGNTENPPTPAEDEQFKVYVNELSWKRFVPPLPVHREFGYGWALTSDVLISLPLSVYVQVIQINYKVDGLEEFLNDPVKQHYLIRFLPSNIKTQLLKYFFSFYENLQKLCYMGLLQFGPMEKFMDKDQGFFYLKKRATIVDTTTCEPHYNLAIEMRPFDRRHYTFTTAQDVENYWFDMLCVCLNTPLGVVRPRSRLSDGDGDREGDEPDVAVGAERYERLQYTLKGSCDVVDDGVTPGDGQGAGGLDSSFFSHLKRNWLWTTHLVSKPKKVTIQSGVGGSTMAPPAVQEDNVQMDVEPSSRNLQVRGGKKNKRKRQKKESSKPTKRKRKGVRLFVKHTLCQDETDRKALLRMTRQRVTWTHLEDSILMLCRVASHFLNRKIKKTFVGWNVVRDILHSELELSLDKTSLSVGRRSRYIMKNPQTQLNYRICLAEVYQDKALIETFMNRTNNYDDPKVCGEEFNEFVSALRTKFSSSYGSSDVVIPDTKEELFNNVEDIHSLVLNNLIQSTLVLSSSQMKTCQSFQVLSPGDVKHPAVVPKTHTGGEDPSVDSALPSGNLREPAVDPLLPPGDVDDSTVDSIAPPTDVEDMLTFPIDAPGGASLCCLSLMTLGLLTVDVSVPQQVVVVDSTLVDINHISTLCMCPSITKELDEEEEDEVEDERRGRFEVKARQASHTNYLLMRGYFVPGIISLRNMNSTDHIAVNSCTVRIQLRRTPAHTLFREAALSVVTRSSVPTVSASLSRVFKQRSSVSEQSFVDKFVPSLGYSSMDMEAVQALRAAVQKEAEFGIDRLELSRMFSHLEQVEHSRSRTLQQYIQELVEVGALSQRLVCVDSGAPWLLQCPTQVCDELVRAFSIPESLKRKLGFSRHQLGSHGPPLAKRPRQAMKMGTMKTTAMVTTSADSAATETVAKETTTVKSTAVDTTAATSVTIETASSIAAVTASAETAASETVQPGKVTIEISTVKLTAVETIPPETSTPGVECSAENLEGARSLPPDPSSSEAGLRDEASGATGSSLQKDNAAEVLSFVARPWRIVDGSLNRPVCKGMLEALLLHIMTNPGVPEPALLQHYSGVLQPVIVLDLLQVLMELGCVKKRFTLNRPKASLFSRPSVPEVRSQGEFGVVEDVVAFYEPTVDCSLRLAQMFPHETNWNKWVQLCVR